jgi:methionine synthase II (cobalamin-independent)
MAPDVQHWGGATGVGSWPGTDPREAARTVLDLLPDLPFLPELPARGAHADLTGRSTALLSGLPVDLQPSGWRLVARPSQDGRRARDLLARDLDALEEAAEAGRPSALKVQCAGPWTLAATLELPRGARALADPGAVDDLAAALAEGLREHLADLARRLPGTRLVLQLDEPGLPAVLAARVPTASGFATLRAPDATRAVEVLRTALAAGTTTVVHCCAASPPVGLLRRAGASAVSLDATLLTPRDDDALGEAAESGTGLLLGTVPSRDAVLSDLTATMSPVTALWRRLGLSAEALATGVVVTPTCGLAGASTAGARRALQACVEGARRLPELVQGEDGEGSSP